MSAYSYIICTHTYMCVLSMYTHPGVEFLDHMVAVDLIFEEPPYSFP